MEVLKILRCLLLLGFLFLCSCSLGVQDDFTEKAKLERDRISAWSQLDGGCQVTILGDLIQSTELESLVSEALNANPGLQQTLLTLKIRQAEYHGTAGEQLPQADFGYSGSRDQESDPRYTGSLTVSWEVDLWQKLSDNTRAAEKDVAEQQALYQSARDTLAAEVMKAWLYLISAQKNVEIEQQRLATLEKTEDFIMQRYRNGLGTLEDLDDARSSTASSKATLEEYKETLAQQKRALKTMLGRAAGSEIRIPEAYSTVILPLVDLPDQTLQRRPDLKAAYLAIEACALRTSVAYKELLPSIDLQAALENVDSSVGMGLINDPVWTVLGQVTAPLFHGGELKAAAKVAELETAQAYQAYRETLLTAVNEIEDAIGLESALGKQQVYIKTALETATNNMQQYQGSYRAGLVEILDLLNVEQQTYDLEIQLNNLTYERLANRIDLGLALGLGAK